MQSEHINPFLESSIFVIEQMCQIKPSLGKLTMKGLSLHNELVCLKISVFGDMEGDLVFGFPKQVALKLVSAMMGGYEITEIDDMSRSAISELGNMISGNASTMLYNQGVTIDITPPVMLQPQEPQANPAKALTIPLQFEGIGEMDIHVLVQSRAS